jgi:Ser/Thr protein kinase RdoA (MazF antagonist)
LTKYVSEADPLPVITSFVRGFAQHGCLTAAECDAVPDLMTLRILSNVIYFTGRALAKEDGIESLTSRAVAYAKRVRWLAANGDAVRTLIRNSVL